MGEKENNFSQIEIRSTNREDGSVFSAVYIDGHRIRGVRSYRLECKAGNTMPTLILDLNALDIAVDQQALLFAEGFGEIDIRFKDMEPSEDGPKND